MRKKTKRYSIPFFFAFFCVTAGLNGCSGLGGVSLGGGTGSSNDPIPSGTLLTQSQFFGQSGQTVSGTATVYVSSNTYIVRLQGMAIPSEAGLFVQVFTSTTQVGNFPLKNTSGNQNYTLTTSAPLTFKSVNIYSTLSNPPAIYGTAQFP